MNKTRTAIAQQKMQQGTYGAQGEKLDWTYYDREKIDPSILTYRYFVNGTGRPFALAAAGNKTISDTNVLGEGITQGQNFRVHEIAMFVWDPNQMLGANNSQMFRSLYGSTVAIKIANKDITWQVNPAQLLGLNYAGVNIGGVQTQFAQDVVRPMFKLRIPIDLAALTQFELLHTWTAAPSPEWAQRYIAFSLRGELNRLS